MKSVSATFIADNSIAANIECGFVPDYIEVITALGGTELIVRFYRCLSDAEATGQYGIIDDGAGVLTPCNSAANGIATYDTSASSYVYVESPKPAGGKILTSVSDWAASTAATARSATAVGTVVRPTTKNGYVYECTNTGTTNNTEGEPTWPTTPGDTVTETDGVIWTCRREEVVRGGAKGFTFGGGISGDGEVCVFRAESHDRIGDLGDAVEKDVLTLP